jgi:hypothetical protein
MILTEENRRTRRKICPSATLSTTNPTWIDPDANPGHRSDRPGPTVSDMERPTRHCKLQFVNNSKLNKCSVFNICDLREVKLGKCELD